MIKIKYCGLKTLTDVANAAQAGVDSIGLVFVKNSQRFVTEDTAKDLIIAAKQAGLVTVALFANQESTEVLRIVEKSDPDVLQFHGNETAIFCEQFERPYWKAVPMLTDLDYISYMNNHPNASAFLLDAFGNQQSGGSGHSFEWFEFPEKVKGRLILAGGINEENVVEAIAETGAEYVDTSTGIETIPGVKSRNKMLSLAKKVKAIQI